jgi:hypothetical protein
VTLSDAPQIMRSHESVGCIDHVFEDRQVVYFRGVADSSYADRATRCRRHVFFVKGQQYFIIVDEFIPKPGVASALQWNIHSWQEFDVDDKQRTFRLKRSDSFLHGHVMHHQNGFFSLSEGWDPPPMAGKDNSQWHQQYHLRFTPSGLEMPKRNLGVVLCPAHDHLIAPPVETSLHDHAEIAHVGDDLVMVNQGKRMTYKTYQTDALVLLVIEGKHYEVGEGGVTVN